MYCIEFYCEDCKISRNFDECNQDYSKESNEHVLLAFCNELVKSCFEVCAMEGKFGGNIHDIHLYRNDVEIFRCKDLRRI